MKEQWLMPGAVVPVDVETTAALVAEIKRLVGVVGGMALAQHKPWVELTKREIDEICLGDEANVRTALDLIKEKNMTKQEQQWIETNNQVCALLRQAHDVLALSSLPPRKRWVGLTSVDWNDFNAVKASDPQYVAQWAAAKLKEKNNG